MSDRGKSAAIVSVDCPLVKLPGHLLIEVFIRVPISDWTHVSCVNKHCANLFREECLWRAALVRSFPLAAKDKIWPGPIPRGSSKRRYAALYVCRNIFSLENELDEIAGHTYLFLKEQLEISKMSPSSGILHGIIIDQFIACDQSPDKAHELASKIWLAVIDNLEETEQTFLILKRLALEGEIFLPYPYSRSYRVQWKVFERLFTDFRDCFDHTDFYDLLACAKHRFQPIPATWLGY
ncbi:hypothetical protein LIER_12888 [Lithospermum erythrorhizon]|uniref:F-box domain-containing protein n=1 Tax=Lithospermum erythrorhizon TaxID=34254 RepID=A0AAV3PVI5_LITER